MDRFASITAFVRVAESGGFSAAGRRLNLSKGDGQRPGSGLGKRARGAAVKPYYAPGFAEGWHFLDPSGNPVVARVSGNLITSSPDTMRAAAVAGIGLVLTAPYIVAGLLASGALVPLLLPGYRTQELEINAFYPHRRHLSAKVRAFIDMLVTWFVEHEHRLRPSGS